ncbi:MULTISPECIES: helix-turn-helix domain-containing protein [Lactobacillus]|uniref:XRE family transcriptional regulator n=1 Tax=Lactobacillus xujianguonis TaxID=2495899 RepID=A0A437SSX8_9LACO|nr:MULTISPECIES: helix-turn-helix transcriptional regulator [Lactobacillus]RVU70041.1 XRE family transcriptional regulator [Lactobacillus xujianguonis]
MTIGQALRRVRNNLGLTQQQMCEGIISRPFYAKVESGNNILNSESLVRILLAHEIDIIAFFDLLQDTYNSAENQMIKQLQTKISQAVNNKDLQALEKYCLDIIANSNSEILKLRAEVTLAYFKGKLDDIDKSTRRKLKDEFDEGRNWTKRPELLQLLANTMPLWSQEELDFLIGRLLDSINKTKFSELMLERYLRLFENCLIVSYDRQIHKKKGYVDHIRDVIDYIIGATAPFHLMIYRIEAIYMQALFEGKSDKAQSIRRNLSEYGYGKAIASWPE